MRKWPPALLLAFVSDSQKVLLCTPRIMSMSP